MKIDKQVCSLNLSVELNKLGIEQNSYFYWYESDLGWTIDHFSKAWGSHISAFTASELFEILPSMICIKEDEPFNNFRFYMSRSLVVEEDMISKRTFLMNYECDTTETDGHMAWVSRILLPHNVWDESLPNALAKTIIELNRLGYLHPEK